MPTIKEVAEELAELKESLGGSDQAHDQAGSRLDAVEGRLDTLERLLQEQVGLRLDG